MMILNNEDVDCCKELEDNKQVAIRGSEGWVEEDCDEALSQA